MDFCYFYVFRYDLSHFLIFFFKQKTAYEMRISDWSSDVCSSDLCWLRVDRRVADMRHHQRFDAIVDQDLERCQLGRTNLVFLASINRQLQMRVGGHCTVSGEMLAGRCEPLRVEPGTKRACQLDDDKIGRAHV